MPRGDGTGPMGMGPMTGRAAGYCAGYPAPGFMQSGGGRGMGMAWGRGGGVGMGMAWRRGRGGGFARGGFVMPLPPAAYAAAPSREDELEMLREQANWLKDQLDAINKRTGELGQQKS